MIRVQFLLKYSLTLFTLLPAVVWADFDPCPIDFADLVRGRVEPHVGETTLARSFPDADTRILGQGEAGGMTYLVTPKTGGNPFVIKDYNKGGPEIATNDRWALEALNVALGARPAQPQAKAIRAIKVLESIDASTLKLQYAKGIDLRTVRSRLSPADEKRLERHFLRNLQDTKRRLEAPSGIWMNDAKYFTQSAEIGTSVDGWPMLNVTLRSGDASSKPRTVKIKLKSDNLLIGPDGEFVIFDPY